MFTFKPGIWIAMGLAVFILLSGCSVNKEGVLLSKIKERGTLRIGTEGTYKPFSFHDEKTDQLTGFDVEVAREVAKRMGVKAEFVEIPWDGMLSSLQTNKIDMVANQVGIKPERKEKFDFSNPYTVSYGLIVVHKDNQEIKGVEQVKGKRAGQTPTSNYGKMAKEAGATIVAYEDMMGAMKDVAAKRIDFSMNDRLAIAEMLKETHLPLKTVGEPMEKSESAFPVPKGNPDLVKEINKALESMKKDGTLGKISEKWFGEDISK
ncbi:transporter substrate-binding domain-containing protein [Paenactinomyces guangxiensis]|uniref:Transporter substrate-binding domain-containing protein n=1 Tax=Paenactinomyces guangxiensis TaxID=1490290 RepID=A0A7W2AAB7_9BACL|nr:transporter substrate-binding domain-containing protein [Paenactinomyces guangxiensis]MBA4495723.1 transporter substrate-binding domain-containing protein [Paenactinomyces guangxiensis]MBH8592712.1 transporter substrate-binding domain-containing protein [Paenactinomyces guangxiensis]